MHWRGGARRERGPLGKRWSYAHSIRRKKSIRRFFVRAHCRTTTNEEKSLPLKGCLSDARAKDASLSIRLRPQKRPEHEASVLLGTPQVDFIHSPDKKRKAE